MPLHDWQFWVVTGAAAIGLLILVRPFLPFRVGGTKGDSGCGSCASGGAGGGGTGVGKHGRRVALTVDRKRI